MYLESQLFLAGTTDAWNAVYTEGKTRNFGTSKDDIDAYASVGGGAAGAAVAGAACTPVAGPVGTYVCGGIGAEIGSLVASGVADLIQSIGASLFGGSSGPTFYEVWDPIAHKAITTIVKALRKRLGEDSENPPDGDFRKWPEWYPVAETWSKNVNAISQADGSIAWFTEQKADIQAPSTLVDPTGKDVLVSMTVFPGDISPFANDRFWGCPRYKTGPTAQSSGFGINNTTCPIASAASLAEYIIKGSTLTASQVLSASSTSTTSTGTKVAVAGLVAGTAGLVWVFHKPIISFVTHLVRRF